MTTRTPKLTLHVSHLIALDRDQRYALLDGEVLEVVGVSIPVWQRKGMNSEPAEEVFCVYRLTNTFPNRPIELHENGYSMNMPQPEFSLIDVIRKELPPTAKKLRDPIDGGTAGLAFTQYGQGFFKDQPIRISHVVEIKDMQRVKNSLAARAQ